MAMKCRVCSPCLKLRAKHWSARAAAEFQHAARTWMLTLTWRPEEHFRALSVARRALAMKSEDLETYTDVQIFAARTRAMQGALQLYLKRVRKSAKCQIRFLCCWEDHKSGLPHAHLLIHEVGGIGVSERLLRTQWKLGFARAKLAETSARWYVTKYLTKSLKARVVASLGYGRDGSERIRTVLQSNLRPNGQGGEATVMSDRRGTGVQRTPLSPQPTPGGSII